jgi:sec-independent protein translocase protein TatC
MRKFSHAIWRVISFPFRAIWWLISMPFRPFKKLSIFLNEEPDEQGLTEAFTATIQHPATLLEHLNVLRKHLLRILVALAICIAIMFAFTEQFVNFLSLPIGGLEKLTAIDVTESVGVFMRVALLGAITIASPYIAFEFWLFAAPGLKPRARKLGLIGIPLVLIFFVGGMAFAYYLMLPTALPFLLNFMGIKALPRVSSYTNFVTGLLFWIGIAFEFPLVIYVISMMGLVKPQALAKHWRIAVVAIAVIAAAVTPTVDPVNMSLVMAPMIILYILSIGLSYLAQIGRKKEAEAAQTG